MSWIITGIQKLDPDAQAYIGRVEQADQANLEPAVKDAINAFVVGCKSDGIWDAIKAGCILTGARTLSGALQPLAGTAPTNNNFVAGDYNRKTGLIGDGSTKYLDSNRNNNADPQNSQHLSVHVSTAGSSAANEGYIGCGLTETGSSHIFRSPTTDGIASRSRNGAIGGNYGAANQIGLIGISRANSSSYTQRSGSANTTISVTSETPLNQSIVVFGRDQVAQTDARIAFYSIGEALDLALLDARVTALINAFATAIP